MFMVGSAAAPVGKDDLRIDLTLHSGADVAVRSAAAMVVWAGEGTNHHVSVRVGDEASLDWQPEPVIVTGSACHYQSTRIELSGSAALHWREIMVLGRHEEKVGMLRSTLDVERDGVALLRHSLAMGTDSCAWDGPAILGPARVLALDLTVGDAAEADARRSGPGWAVMPLGGGSASLVLAVGKTVDSVRTALAEQVHVHIPVTRPKSLRNPPRLAAESRR